MDDDSLGYYLMFNLPIVVYLVAFLYVFFVYERGYLSAHQPAGVVSSGDTEQNLLPA